MNAFLTSNYAENINGDAFDEISSIKGSELKLVTNVLFHLTVFCANIKLCMYKIVNTGNYAYGKSILSTR